ncbi:hypothetical protein PIB30_017041 [Stylosanthes scabra]|uniref:Uncharacterized protein n=1 Tax=Stylosanthes scabra TaxID=79078 RepID=A0ABU6R7S1_9FABA|nr:hypothetical protein [Stylosanthes scabra]
MATNSNGTPPTNIELLALDDRIDLTEGGGPILDELTPFEGESPKVKKGTFKDEIRKFGMPANFTKPTTLKPYDGSGAPKIHVTKFENMMLLNGSSDLMLCRSFPIF